jgi:TRAP-type C4-dicarboxylate transport system substrate-binding protein
MMKKAKTVTALILVLVLSLALFAGCSSSASSASSSAAPAATATPETKTPVVIRIGGTVNDEHTLTQAEYKFEELFEAATDGAYDVQVYTNMALGSPLEMLEAVQLGNLEMADSGNMILASYDTGLMFMDIPFLFPSAEVAKAFVNSDVALACYDRIAERSGIRPVAPMDLGYMTLSNNVREVHTTSDLKGIKFRVQENDMYLKYWEAMGGTPTPLAFNEVFTACQQGTIDGLTTQNAVFHSNRYYEVVKYLSDMNPYYCFAPIYTSEKWLESLSEEDRETFFQCWNEAQTYNFEIMGDYIDEVNADLETKMTVSHLTDEERKEFEDSAEPMIEYFRQSVGDDHLDDYLAEIEKLEASLTP